MARSGGRRWPVRILMVVVVLTIVAAGVLAASRPAGSPHTAGGLAHSSRRAPTHRAPSTEPTTTTTTTTTLPPPAAGFVPGHVTAVGDSVMIDYQSPLESDIPGIDVEAAVSRQWGAGEDVLTQLKAEGHLGAEVVVALGTNGPISSTDFDEMMNILRGASRVVFVNVHVDRPWQDSNNAVLAQGAATSSRVVIADWATLANDNPQWFGPDGTHLAIDGPGAQALASLIATTVSKG